MTQNQLTLGAKRSEILANIVKNLSDGNIYLSEQEGQIRLYRIREHKSEDTITLSNLLWQITEKLDMNPKFQRNSTDHKSRTPQQIVVDYLSGQLLGSILLYKPFNSNKKLVVDGRHRLNHLSKFVEGKLELTNNEARDFWSLYLDKIQTLVMNSSSNVELNKLIQGLSKPKVSKDGLLVFPKVNFTRLPSIIKDEILNGIKLDLNEIHVTVEDTNGNTLQLQKCDEETIDKIIWRKFTRMNNNSGKITVDDAIWNLPIIYAENSTNLANNSVLQNFFGVNSDDRDDVKKLNEIFFTTMLFLDKKFSWGGSTKAIMNHSHKPSFQKIEQNSSDFFSTFHTSFTFGYDRFFRRGEKLSLPAEITTIKGGNKIFIKQFMLFVFLFHKFSKNPLYADVPTTFHREVLTLAGKIIVTCVKDKNGEIPLENLKKNNLNSLYEQNQELFVKIAEYRKNQRSYDDIIKVYTDLVHLCMSVVY